MIITKEYKRGEKSRPDKINSLWYLVRNFVPKIRKVNREKRTKLALALRRSPPAGRLENNDLISSG